MVATVLLIKLLRSTFDCGIQASEAQNSMQQLQRQKTKCVQGEQTFQISQKYQISNTKYRKTTSENKIPVRFPQKRDVFLLWVLKYHRKDNLWLGKQWFGAETSNFWNVWDQKQVILLFSVSISLLRFAFCYRSDSNAYRLRTHDRFLSVFRWKHDPNFDQLAQNWLKKTMPRQTASMR